MATEPEAALDRQAFLASLPRKRVAAGALIRDERGGICIVEPTYKTKWHFPGGTVEADESPAAGCRRELFEELGLDIAVGRLLCVEWVTEDGDPHGALMFVYDGGVLGPAAIESISLPADELSAFRFVDPAEVDRWVSPANARRAASALGALTRGTVEEIDRDAARDQQRNR